MWVSNKIFMELVERVVKAEEKAAALEGRVKRLEEKPIVGGKIDELPMQAPGQIASSDPLDASKLLDELLNGVPDEVIGRVKYTNGRE